MRFPHAEVRRLLSEQFEQIETLWDDDPFDEAAAFALTVKEFMGDHAITDVDQGIQRFVEFKQQQARGLDKVGLGCATDFSSRLPSRPRLAPQAA